MAAHSQAPVLVYADGSCLGNPGPGGWGVVIVEPGGGTRTFSGGDPRTTNNRMEMTAAIEALRRLPAGIKVLLRSDSQYLVKSINYGWKRNANVDLWNALDAELAQRKVKFEWVRGHAGDQMNERADRLALEAAKAAANGRQTPNRAPDAPIQPAPAASAAPSERASQSPLPDAATVEALRPLLNEGETIRRCDGCGGHFIAPERYKDSYCALIACQLRRRSRQKQPRGENNPEA